MKSVGEDSEKALREESERTYQRWLKEKGSSQKQKTPKARKKRPNINPRSVLKYSALCVLFFAAAFGFGWLFSLLSGLPGLGALPGWVIPTVAALLALSVTAVAGQKFTSTKRSLAVATACLVVFLAVSAVPRPPQVNLPAPEVPPKGYVEFYYQASFTYMGSSAGSISDVKLWLPWPYIDTHETRPFAKPVGLDNWLHEENGSAGGSCPVKLAQLVYGYLVNSLSLVKGEATIGENDNESGYSITVENGIWSANRIIDYTEVENLKIVHEGRLTTPAISAYFERAQDKTMAIFQKITVEVPVMSSGDTVSAEYMFFVPEENAAKVRVDDWIDSYIIWILSGAYEQGKIYENAPYVSANFTGPPIQCRFSVSLWKDVDGSGFERVSNYQREWDSWRAPGFSTVSNG